MFTGIIGEIGRIERLDSDGGKRFFTIDCHRMQAGLAIGDSVCCNGICMTVTAFSPDFIKTEAMNETMVKTTAGIWRPGTLLHLERALKADGRIDGHFVQGHVDSMARVRNTSQQGGTLYLDIEIPAGSARLLVPQGSVAIDGVSLTVARLGGDTFSVALIGLTMEKTQLKHLRPGDRVNLEFDIIGKYILRMVEYKPTADLQQLLRDNGF